MEFAAIGSFSKTHGIKGHLVLFEEEDFEVEGLQAFFCDSATGKVPYFIEELRDTAQGLLVKLEEVNTVEVAKTLVKKTVYVEKRFFIATETTGDFIGYELHDENLGLLGKVTASSNNGVQDLVSLEHNGREVILPLVDEFVVEINEADKKIHYRAPEGLIDIYLE